MFLFFLLLFSLVKPSDFCIYVFECFNVTLADYQPIKTITLLNSYTIPLCQKESSPDSNPPENNFISGTCSEQ